MKISATAVALLLVLPWSVDGAYAQHGGGGGFGGGAMMGGGGFGGGGFHGGGGGGAMMGGGGFHGGAMAGGFHGGAMAGGFHGGAMTGGWHGGNGGWHGGFHGHDFHDHNSFGIVVGGWPWYDPWPYYYPYWSGYYGPYYDNSYYDSYYPTSATVPVVTGPAPAPTWYYCDNPAGYYPYVRTCSGPWQTLPATPTAGAASTALLPGASAAVAVAN